MYIRVTLYCGYLIILLLFHLCISCTVSVLVCTLVVLYCFVMCGCVCMCGFCNVWVCVCVCRLCIVWVVVICILYSEVFLTLTEVFLTMTEVFPCFFLSYVVL